MSAKKTRAERIDAAFTTDPVEPDAPNQPETPAVVTLGNLKNASVTRTMSKLFITVQTSDGQLASFCTDNIISKPARQVFDAWAKENGC